MSYEILNMAISPIKVVILIGIFIFTNWVLNGRFDKYIHKLKVLKKRYGIVTILLIIAWWLITPSGNVDDVITVWLIATLGITYYLLIVTLLTLYIIWRLKVTLVIYKN